MVQSAGVLLYRRRNEVIEVLIAHPGGPIWAGRDAGAWSIPKGELDEYEAPSLAAARELLEEVGVVVDAGSLVPLGTVRQAGGKVVHGFAAEGDAPEGPVSGSTFEMEWPPRSGRIRAFPEVDRVAWVGPETARGKLVTAQVELVDRLLQLLDGSRE